MKFSDMMGTAPEEGAEVAETTPAIPSAPEQSSGAEAPIRFGGTRSEELTDLAAAAAAFEAPADADLPETSEKAIDADALPTQPVEPSETEVPSNDDASAIGAGGTTGTVEAEATAPVEFDIPAPATIEAEATEPAPVVGAVVGSPRDDFDRSDVIAELLPPAASDPELDASAWLEGIGAIDDDLLPR